MQKKFLISQGGKTANEVIRRAFPAVIARPVLAEKFNCGGAAKSGSVLKDTQEKRNIMGTIIQSLLITCKLTSFVLFVCSRSRVPIAL